MHSIQVDRWVNGSLQNQTLHFCCAHMTIWSWKHLNYPSHWPFTTGYVCQKDQYKITHL